MKKNFIFNKVFSGSYLSYNLGNELINFIKLKSSNEKYNNRRFIYINPYGVHKRKADYVLHIMKTNYSGETYYELVAISEVDETKNLSLYSKNASDIRTKISENNISFEGKSLEKIFDDENSHLCSFIAKNFYTPKEETRILFQVVDNDTKISHDIPKPEIIGITGHYQKIYKIKIRSNPQHSMCYSKNVDNDILFQIKENFFKLDNDFNIDLPEDTEQCLALICDRTNLEDSTSNQIAYFFNRDKNLLNLFIKQFLGIPLEDNYNIIREKAHIDLLIEGKNNVIVMENKIDSGINDNQLKKYEEYIEHSEKKAYFYILEPSYSLITENEKNKNGGKKYKIVYYDDLYKILKNSKYKPNGKSNEYSDFLYKEFLYTIEYIQMSKAEQQKKIACIRLKQKLDNVEKENSKV